ncbi:MAG TPA: transporter substrate-binding domain-containing protein [Hyphomicrobiaceae bacterium]|nr:transporter substrate-binding domain-containing protein [Hyphomicrobiaceae bacterium]
MDTDKNAAIKELAPTGRLRVGVAVGPTVGAGNVAIDAATGKPKGIAVDLGKELADRLGVPVEYVPYPNSGALTEAAASGAWDVAFLPVDEERRKKVDFGPAHMVLQSTYLVAPGSAVKTHADVDRLGIRVAGIENTATTRAAQRSLKAVVIMNVKTADELLSLLRTGQVEAVVQSREALIGLAKKLPGARVLDGSFLNSFVAVAVPKGRPAALACVSSFIEEAKASGLVRRALDNAGLTTSTVAPAGQMP